MKYRNLSELHKLEDNPRTIDKDSFDSLCQSIKDNPDYFEARPLILSNRTGKLVILGGNQRYEAAKKLGLEKVPTHLIEGLTEEREEEITIRDNVNNGDWDWDKLANRYDYDKLDEWGVEVPELEEKEDDTKIEEVPTPEIEEAAKSELGKIYKLGEHRLMCGDSTKAEDVFSLMGGTTAALIHTDPPYGVSYNSDTQGSIQNDEIVGSELYDFLNKALKNAYATSAEKCACYVWHAYATEREFYKAIEDAGFVVKQQIIWNKESLVLGRASYHWKHEPCYLAFKDGLRPEEAAERKSTTVWDSPETLKTLSKKQLLEEIEKWKDDSTVWDLKRDPRSEYIHPTQKPVAIPARAIKKHSKEGDTILDLFAGSGSTLLACEQLGRKCRTMELDPRFVDRIRKRYHYFQSGSIDGWEEATPAIN